MQLELHSVAFDDAAIGVNGARAKDGQGISIFFEHLGVESQAGLRGTQPSWRCAEGEVRCSGTGWAKVNVRGRIKLRGNYGFAHILSWLNGQRLRCHGPQAARAYSAGAVVPVGPDGRLRLTIFMLAQHDYADNSAISQCDVESLVIRVVPAPQSTVFNPGERVARTRALLGSAS